jgi:hypothetical protein
MDLRLPAHRTRIYLCRGDRPATNLMISREMPLDQAIFVFGM